MSRRIFAFILSSLLCLGTFAQVVDAGPDSQEGSKPDTEKEEAKKPSFLQGASLGFDIAAPIMGALGSDAIGTEAALRINVRNKYFPVVELGYSKYDGTNDDTSIRYKTSAPYMRAGIDFNVLKDKSQPNRLYAGFRVAYTSFSFDADGPDIEDPIWQGTEQFAMSGIKCDRLWAELVLGVEAEVFSHIHMGFAIRYKSKLSGKSPESGGPYYVPGFGTGESSAIGATYNITFDLTRKAKKIKNINNGQK